MRSFFTQNGRKFVASVLLVLLGLPVILETVRTPNPRPAADLSALLLAAGPMSQVVSAARAESKGNRCGGLPCNKQIASGTIVSCVLLIMMLSPLYRPWLILKLISLVGMFCWWGYVPLLVLVAVD